MEISLKTSVLIQKLMEIDKTVPFDADVVTGEEWWPTPISRVYHNPPHTFVEFETGELTLAQIQYSAKSETSCNPTKICNLKKLSQS